MPDHSSPAWVRIGNQQFLVRGVEPLWLNVTPEGALLDAPPMRIPRAFVRYCYA